MNDQYGAFSQRQILGEEKIETKGQKHEHKDEQSGLPKGGHIGVWVDEQYHALDHAREELSCCRNPRDPA